MLFVRSTSMQIMVLLAFVACAGCDANIPKNKSGATTDGSKSNDKGGSADPSGLKRIVIPSSGDSPFWDACREGMLAANSDLFLKDAGLVAVMEVNDNTAQGQLAKLQQYGTQSDVVGVGVSAIDATNVAIADELRAMQKKGIKVVTIDSDIDRARFSDARYAFIGTDNLTGGKVLGKCAKGLKPDGGEYVTFVGISGAQNAIDRIGGFGQGAGEKFVAKDAMEDGGDRPKARENVRNAISNHPGVSTLVGIWSYNAPAIVDVVREANRRKDFTVVVFDAEPTAITAVAEGNIDAMVVQNPFQMGYQGVRILKALIENKKDVLAELLPNHGKPEGDIYDTGLKVVVPNADSPLKADQFDKGVEFLTLDKFQEWLKKYGLTGS